MIPKSHTTTIGRVNDGVRGVYIGRPVPGQPWNWGNPFSIGDKHPQTGRPMSRDEAVAAFERWLIEGKDDRARWIIENVHRLKGKHLQCFCAPLRCHGEILRDLAEARAIG